MMLMARLTEAWQSLMSQLWSLGEKDILTLLSISMIASAAVTATAMLLIRVRASYGRYSPESILFKISVPARIAWFIQELPSLLIPLIALRQADSPIRVENLVAVGMFAGHYFHRTLIYPLLIRGGKPTPVHLLVLGIIFTTWNGYIQGYYHAKYAHYPPGYTQSIRGIAGIGIFLAGMLINVHSDRILRNLRSPGETGYKIPRGGLFEYVSGANFFGEILEWFGYAIYAASLAGWAFALFTLANLLPRAIEHHRWYLKKFDDYPKRRRAIIPFIL